MSQQWTPISQSQILINELEAHAKKDKNQVTLCN